MFQETIKGQIECWVFLTNNQSNRKLETSQFN